jgi:hypothetical protein
MNISTNTLSVLKSFTSINPSLYVNSGNVIKTISPQKTIIGRAEVDDSFDVPFGIYDLNQFLSTVSIFESPDFEFSDRSVEIKNGVSSVTYGYADANMIMQAPEKDLDLPDVVVEFELKDAVFKKTMQAASVLQLPNWSVIGAGGDVTLVVGNSKDESSNTFRHVVGSTDLDFELVFKVENLRFMPADYNVKISSKGISHFSTNGGKLQYYIATESR